MRIGYAAVNASLYPRKYSSVRLKTIQEKGIYKLKSVILKNIDHLRLVLEWNLDHDIYFYRFPSNIFPLVTHPAIKKISTWRWFEDDDILTELSKIKNYVIENRIRISTHPDQYIVLNSNLEKVVSSSIETLNNLSKLLQYLGGSDLIIHVGGVYGNKADAMKRFIDNFYRLSPETQNVLRIENDDKSYSAQDVLTIGSKINVPVIIDLHHYRCVEKNEITIEVIKAVEKTWKGMRPKAHISSGKSSVLDRKHADYILAEDVSLSKKLLGNRFDIMIEAKAKEKACLDFRDKFSVD